MEEHGWGTERTRVVFGSAPHYFHIHTPAALSSSEGSSRRDGELRVGGVQRRAGTDGKRKRGKKKEADRVEIGLLGKGEKKKRKKKKEGGKPQRLPEGDVQKTNKQGRRGKAAKKANLTAPRDREIELLMGNNCSGGRKTKSGGERK